MPVVPPCSSAESSEAIPSYAQGFGGLSFSHSTTVIGRGLLRRRIKNLGPDSSTDVSEVSWKFEKEES
jgi:hypothetical protein